MIHIWFRPDDSGRLNSGRTIQAGRFRPVTIQAEHDSGPSRFRPISIQVGNARFRPDTIQAERFRPGTIQAHHDSGPFGTIQAGHDSGRARFRPSFII